MAKFKLQPDYSEYVTKTFRIPKHIINELSEVAAKENLSLNKAVIQCLEFALQSMKEE